MFTHLGQRRRQPGRVPPGQAAGRSARPHLHDRHARRGIPQGRHLRVARRRHHRSDDPVPRHRRPVHAERGPGGRHALLERDHGHHQPGGVAGRASAATAARPRRSPSTWRSRWSTSGRATPPGTARNATARRRSAPTTCTSAAASPTGSTWQGRHPAGRRAAAAAGQPDRRDEPGPQAAAASSGTSRAASRRSWSPPVTTTPPAARRAGSTSTRRTARPAAWSTTGSAPGSRRTSIRTRRCPTPRRRPTSRGGFEVGLHVSTNCANYTPSSLTGVLHQPARHLAGEVHHRPAPVSNRTHCIVWSDWSSQASTEVANGIRLDTNYYYWPGSWVADRPGFMTGSGMPMRFAAKTGGLIDAYQAATQMTDESGQSYPFTVEHPARSGARCRRATTAPSPRTCTPTTPPSTRATRCSPRRRPAACR